MGIGASAGGLQAIGELLGSLPKDSGMAYVIVQHLSVDYESNLAVILERYTEMKVIFLTEDIVPEPNTVYLRPPEKEVELHQGRLILSPRQQDDHSLYFPIDNFLLSLAIDQKSFAIAIILSGMGSDGSRGIKEIKEKGGIVLVQSPDSAQFSGMPNAAIRFEVADFIGTASEIASTLVAIAQREPGPNQKSFFEEISLPEYDTLIGKILHLIKQEIQIDFSHYRLSTVQRRIEKRLLIHMIDDPEDYLTMLAANREELQLLAQSFLIGVTRFFRDPEAFELIEKELIPQLAKISKPGIPLRIWVPACSTGEEAYSIAMMVDHYLSLHHPEQDFKILASDLDPKAIQIASEAYYPTNVAADIPEKYLSRYMSGFYGGYRVNLKLREKILFAVQNLLTDPPFIHIDFISCRNFLIYIDVEAQIDIMANFHFSLNPQGFLMLGPSESLGQLQRSFTTIDRRWKVFSRRESDNKRMIGKGRKLPLLPQRIHALSPSEIPAIAAADLEVYRNDSQDVFAQYLSGQYAPPSVFVDKNHEIRYINGRLDHFFHFPRNHTAFSLDKVLNKEVSFLLRAAVDNLINGNEDYTEQEIVLDSLSVKGHLFEATLQEVTLADLDERLVMIEIKQLSENETTQDRTKAIKPDQLLQRRIYSLEERLVLSEQRARRLLNELEATNEELQTSNRELLAANEEMQSTNEELQSVNEELHTVNHEMQHKNDLLKILNNDINHLLESTEIGTIFLDGDLNIRRFTPSIRKQFDLKDSDVSRPLSSFSSSFPHLQLPSLCRQVLDSRVRYEEEITDHHSRTHLLRILPHSSPENDETGLIISFIDIHDLALAQLLLKKTAAKYEVLMNNLEDTIMVVDRQTRIKQINHWLSPAVSADSLMGKYLVDLLESDAEQLRLHSILRQVFDDEQTVRDTFHFSGTGKDATYAEITFLLNPGIVTSKELRSEDRAILIVRDISASVIEQEKTRRLLKEYQARLASTDDQMGIMDLNGNILGLNQSRIDGASSEDFIQKSIYDFLTPTGADKINQVFENLQNGSFYERVDYLPADLTIPSPDNGISVSYEPIISNGEVICVLVQNLDNARDGQK